MGHLRKSLKGQLFALLIFPALLLHLVTPGARGADNAWPLNNYGVKAKGTVSIWTGDPMRLLPPSTHLARQEKQKFFVSAAIFLGAMIFPNTIPN